MFEEENHQLKATLADRLKELDTLKQKLKEAQNDSLINQRQNGMQGISKPTEENNKFKAKLKMFEEENHESKATLDRLKELDTLNQNLKEILNDNLINQRQNGFQNPN